MAQTTWRQADGLVFSMLLRRLVTMTRTDVFRVMITIGGWWRWIMHSGPKALLPTCTLTMMILVVKILVIMATSLVGAPIRILALKIRPVYRMGLIPGIPSGRIPLRGPGGLGVHPHRRGVQSGAHPQPYGRGFSLKRRRRPEYGDSPGNRQSKEQSAQIY